MRPQQKLVLSGLVIAMYIVLTGLFAGISFGAVQIRVSNVIYSLSFLYPFLVIPTAIGVGLSNVLFGGLGLIDIVFGSLTGLIVCSIISKLPRPLYIIPVKILGVGLLVPLWLHYFFELPYFTLVISISLGQVFPALAGYFLIKWIENNSYLS